MLFVLSACDDPNNLGLEILPGTDLIHVKSKVIKDEISAYANSESGIVTNRDSRNLLGSINDPVFGNTTVNFATQLRIESYTDFGTNPVVDSTFLYLYYRTVYGDTITPMHLKVYELEEMLYNEQEYTQDIDLKSMASNEVIGELTFTPKVVLDSVRRDTVPQILKIPIESSFSQKFISADSADMVIIDTFLEKICKGIYIESEKVNTEESGSLITVETAPTQSVRASLRIFYNNDKNKSIAKPDTLSKPYVVTKNSPRVSSILHDYSGTDFINEVDQEVEQKEFLYIQPTGGLKSFITIDGLESWRDSVNIAINKAELIFQVDTVKSNVESYPPPGKLLLTYINKDGKERYPVDYLNLGSLFYGGFLRKDYTYHFNITQHIQRIIDITNPNDNKYVGNQGFYLTTGQLSSNAQRVVLEGTDKKGGVKLIITYSEYKR